MAVLYPDSQKTKVIFISDAEQQFYDACRSQLGNDWKVYYSCNLSAMEDENGLRDNEIDFVAYHKDIGIIVIEVKGGRIHYDRDLSVFYSVNRNDERFKIKDPFKQALVWKSRFFRYLRKKGIKVPICHAVCFPSVEETEFPVMASVEPQILIGRSKIKSLEKSLIELAHASLPKREEEGIKDVSLQLDKILAGTTFTSKLFLRDYIDSQNFKVKDIEEVSDSLLTPIATSSRLGIEGEAGTGKTILALLLAKKFLLEGKRVLLLSSNLLLNLFFKKEIGDGVEIYTYIELAALFDVNLLEPSKGFEGDRKDWLQFAGPEKLKKAISSSGKKYDAVICDEAQDVQPFWWEAYEELLAKESRLYLFFDRSQGVFGAGGEGEKFIPEDILPVPSNYFPLVNNYRNTREIAGFARAFRTGRSILQSHCGRIGYIPEIITYKDHEDCQRLLGGLLRKLTRTEKLETHEITLLSARDPNAKDSVLYQCNEVAKYPLYRLIHKRKTDWAEATAPKGSVALSTIVGFKGLETPVGVLLNLSEYNLPLTHPILSSLVYVACSRAKHMLYVFVKVGDPKLKIMQKALRQLDASGGLVLHGANLDFEFVGTVAHYNPDRVGWLKVSDPAFQRSNIMFFPEDVKKAGLSGLKVGSKLKFRPQVEGLATIACDLKLPESA
ncbi:MAG: NERD domain-containing protein [Bdellovibrionota bacterium]